ncbi:MAG: GatB/YqeY domain-containing protein [Candidatus Omnitrophica bacterium]|nr:GatB/YqeY domain-containing protein [Candidatus Omnitrophota bacterium]MCM8798420.1 GatB/YqeY domain-containing protein [Candidatus Omnitrophota bacterium]
MLEEKIYQDYLQALKNREKEKTDFLSFIRSELKNFAIQLRKDKLSDEEVLTVLHKQRKRLEESGETIKLSKRQDMIDKIERELALLKTYLPQPLNESELRELIARKIEETQATSLKDMGKVMKEVLAEVGIRAEAKKVSELVREKLSVLS